MRPPSSVYDENADWYADVVRRRGLIHLQIIPQIMAFTGDVTGQHIVDIACGEGVFTRELASAGAVATGIDLSARLLDIARDTPHPATPTYIHDDARSFSTVPDASFDGATCIMAMMDIDDIEAVFRPAYRITRDDAVFVVLITHPCFEAPGARTEMLDGEVTRVISQYLTEGYWRGTEDGVRSRFGAQHRTVSTYLNTAIDTGWSLERMAEPRLACAAVGEDGPVCDHPGLLMMRFRRQR